MALVDHLPGTVTVRRYTIDGEDDRGNPTVSWADHLAGVAARWSIDRIEETRSGGHVVATERYKVTLGGAPDVTVEDRMVIDGAERRIVGVDPHQGRTAVHHTTVWVERVDT